MLIYSVLSTFPLFVFFEVCLQKRIKKTSKINEKSVPEEAPRQLKSTQDRTWDFFGMPRCVQERSKGISGASGECLRARSARPGSTQSVPKGASGRQRGRQGALSSSPRRPQSTPNLRRERPNLVFFVQLVCEALSERFFVDCC